MLNMTKIVCVCVVVAGSSLLTGCGMTSAFKEAKEAVSYAFSSKTPTEQLDAYEEEVNTTYPTIRNGKVDDKTIARMNADAEIKRSSAMAKKCEELLSKFPPINAEKNDEDQLQQRENIENRQVAYIAALKQVCDKAKTDNLAVSIPTGTKFLARDHEAYASLREPAATATKQ